MEVIHPVFIETHHLHAAFRILMHVLFQGDLLTRFSEFICSPSFLQQRYSLI